MVAMNIEELEVTTLASVADDLHVHPAAVYQACARIGIGTLRVGRGTLLERKHVPAIAREVTRHLLATRETVG